MRIFISHAFKDENLASELKKFLEKNEQIEEAYMAIRSPDFELEISEKVTKEIKNSDYLVAIITKTSKSRPSVHQELGFAQGTSIHKIPLIEKNAKKGVLLEGREHILFEKEKFQESCKKVLDYIIIRGPTRRKFTEQEKNLAQESAHFRMKIEYETITFLHNMLYHLEIVPDAYDIISSNDGREKTHEILENFVKEKDSMYQKVGKLPFRNLFSIYDDFKLLKNNVEESKNLPCSKLFFDEQDAFLKLNDRILEVNSSSIDLHDFFYNILKINVDYDTTFLKLIESRKDLPSLPNNLSLFAFDVRIITKAVVNMDKILLKIRKKFGDMAFKGVYDDEAA